MRRSCPWHSRVSIKWKQISIEIKESPRTYQAFWAIGAGAFMAAQAIH